MWILILKSQTDFNAPKKSGISGPSCTSTNGVTWPKKLCCTSFQSYWSKGCNDAIDDAVGITWHWC